MRVYKESSEKELKNVQVTLCVDVVGKVIGNDSLNDIIEADAYFAIDRYVEAIRVFIAKGWRVDITNFSNPALAEYSVETIAKPRFKVRVEAPKGYEDSMVVVVNIKDKTRFNNAMRAFWNEFKWGICIMKPKNSNNQGNDTKK